MDPVAVDVERALWDSAFSLVCAIVGSSAGLYALFRLPLMLQVFHPGSFLLALLISMLVLALPMCVAELSLGQRLRLAAIPAMDSVVKGGRGIAFASVIVCSLLTAAYSSTALALIVSPSFGDVVGVDSSVATSTSNMTTNSSVVNNTTTTNNNNNNMSSSNDDRRTFLSGGDWLTILALLVMWALSALLSYSFVAHASLLSKVMLPLPLVLWCVVAIYTAATAADQEEMEQHPDDFRAVTLSDLLIPRARYLRGTRLWANSAGQALLLLQVGTGFTMTAGSKAKAVHSTANVAVALFSAAMLFSFFITVAGAGSIAAASSVNIKNQRNASTNTSSITGGNGNGFEEGELLPRDTLPVLLPALFIDRDAGSKLLGIVVFATALLAGIFSLMLVLQSFLSSMSDLHVALRTHWTVVVAAVLCFAVAAPMSVGAIPAIVVVALDQAVVGACLPLLVMAESLSFAFGGWNAGPSVLRVLGDIWGEDIDCRGKLTSWCDALVNFGNARLRALLFGGGAGAGGGVGGELSIGSSNSGGVRQTSNINGSMLLILNNNAAGRLFGAILPFFLKIVVPVCSLLVFFATVASFGMAPDATPAAKAVFAMVVIATCVLVFAVAHRSLLLDGADEPLPPTSSTAAPTANAARGRHARTTSLTDNDDNDDGFHNDVYNLDAAVDAEQQVNANVYADQFASSQRNARRSRSAKPWSDDLNNTAIINHPSAMRAGIRVAATSPSMSMMMSSVPPSRQQQQAGRAMRANDDDDLELTRTHSPRSGNVAPVVRSKEWQDDEN